MGWRPIPARPATSSSRNKKNKEKLEMELRLMPIKFKNFKMKRTIEEKYLGHMLHKDG